MMYLGKDPVAVTAFGSGSGEDTKNTAGATDTSDKLFIVGAKTQTENPQTYTQDTAYVGTDGCLYSDGQKVLTSHQDISVKAPLASPAFTGTPTAPTAASGTNTTQIATTAFVQDAVGSVSGGSGGVPFGVCSTAANTAIKEVTISGITELTNGLRISVYFINGNTAISPYLQLNLNNLGAKRILPRTPDNSTSYDFNIILDKQVIDLVYYNDYWYAINHVMANAVVPGLVRVNSLAIDSIGAAPRAVIDVASFHDFYKEYTIPQASIGMIRDQYTRGLGEDEYRFVLKFYHVDNTGKTYYTSDHSVYYTEIDDDYYSGITLFVYGCDQNNTRTLLDQASPHWTPPSWNPIDVINDNNFMFLNGVMVYAFKSDATTLNQYHHLECVVTSSIDGITMYHPLQDLTFDLSSLSHDVIEIKNIGLNISGVLASEAHTNASVFVRSMFDIPDDTEYSAQTGYTFDESEEVSQGNIVIGYDFYVPDWTLVNGNPAYGYSVREDLLGNWRIIGSDSMPYMLAGKMFICPDGIYITDYRLCKKTPLLSDGSSSIWQGGSF